MIQSVPHFSGAIVRLQTGALPAEAPGARHAALLSQSPEHAALLSQCGLLARL